MHGAEEHPSPSGFAMVFQKAPFSPKNNANNLNKVNNNPTTVTPIHSDSSGGHSASVLNNNIQASGCTTSSSSALSYMVNCNMLFF